MILYNARMKWRMTKSLLLAAWLAGAGNAAAGPNDEFLACIYPQADRPNEIIQTCSKLLNAKGGNDEARAAALLSRGNMYRRTRQFDLALADYDAALRLDPNSAALYTSRGNAWRGKRDYTRALADHDKAIELDHDYAEAFSNRGNVRADRRDYDRAIADYDKAIELKPDYAIAFYNRGLAWKAKGDRTRAIADYRQALKSDAKLSAAAAALKTLGENP
jgi:tetratricopeptide (TPR) repeat protein